MIGPMGPMTRSVSLARGRATMAATRTAAGTCPPAAQVDQRCGELSAHHARRRGTRGRTVAAGGGRPCSRATAGVGAERSALRYAGWVGASTAEDERGGEHSANFGTVAETSGPREEDRPRDYRGCDSARHPLVPPASATTRSAMSERT